MASKRFEVENGREPTNAELAAIFGTTEKSIEKLKMYDQDNVSINSMVGDDHEAELGDFIADPNNQVEDFVINNSTREKIKLLFDKANLTDREIDILVLRFGLDGGTPMTLEEVGKIYHLTRERIRQLEARALKKSRFAGRKMQLDKYLKS